MSNVSEVVDIIRRTALDAVVAADSDGRICAVNDAACTMFDCSADELVGRTIGETIVPPSMRNAHEQGMQRYAATGRAHVVGQRIEIEAQRSDGTIFPIELSITEVEDSGRHYFVSYLRDITEREAQCAAVEKSRDEAQQAADSRSQLIAMLGHDLRTPLNGITSALEIALAADCPEEARKATAMARRSAAAAVSLTEDLLSYSQLEAGALTLNPTPTTLDQFQRECFERWRPRFEAKGLRFSFELLPDLRRCVMMDSARLKQIFDNLLSNALKFTETGSVTATMGWMPDGRIEITVSDTGEGIGDWDPELAFGAFKRRRADGGGGVGLGLWIVKSLVDLHGGEIALQPRPGGGAKAIVRLPIERAPKHLAASLNQQQLAGLTALVVDDNETNRFVAERMLKGLGCSVVSVENGSRAVIEARRGFDLILMDLDMPVMDGFEATRLIRAEEDTARQPVMLLALTAYSTAEHEARIVAAGADGLLAKPIRSAEHLGGAIAQHMRRQTLRSSPPAAGVPTPVDGGAVLLDDKVVRGLADALGPDEMRILAGKFISDVTEGAEAVARWAPTFELAQLRRATHMLDAVAGTLGAMRLQTLAHTLNQACHTADRARIEQDAPELVAVARATLQSFERDWSQAAQGGDQQP